MQASPRPYDGTGLTLWISLKFAVSGFQSQLYTFSIFSLLSCSFLIGLSTKIQKNPVVVTKLLQQQIAAQPKKAEQDFRNFRGGCQGSPRFRKET